MSDSFECNHAKDEGCPHYDASIRLYHELEKLKEAKCSRCGDAHELLSEHGIPRTGGIWSVGEGVWSVKARIGMLINRWEGK